jgi:hypothetical protein
MYVIAHHEVLDPARFWGNKRSGISTGFGASGGPSRQTPTGRRIAPSVDGAPADGSQRERSVFFLSRSAPAFSQSPTASPPGRRARGHRDR